MKNLFPLVFLTGLIGVQGAAPQARHTGPSAGEPEASASPAAVAAVRDLRSDLADIIRRPRWSGDEWSVMVQSLDQGDTLFAQGHDRLLAPASNLKLFTTAAALYYLGPDFRYNTFLMSTGAIQGNVLDGDLVLYGTGDPTFSGRFGNAVRVFEAFADTLATLGITQVRGDVVGDGSYFSGPGAGEGWQDSYMNAAYAASAGALSFAENVATLKIEPGAQAGHRPVVTLVPGGEGIAIVNQATTTASGRTRVTARRVAYDGPILLTGSISRSAGAVTRAVPVSDPARMSAAVFRYVLEKRGITVTGGVRSVAAESASPVGSRSVFAPALDTQRPVRVLAVHTSEPIQQVIEIINKRSHNMMAEQVLRTVGRVAMGEGSVAAGERAVRHMVEQAGTGTTVRMYDGSGLSVLNRASAADFVALLDVMAESPMWSSYWESLPEAGSSTLRRMGGTAASQNLRAKTGTINNVSSLSGYVTAANGERLAFSIISNRVPSTWMAKRVEDAIGTRLAEFTRPLEAVPADVSAGGEAPVAAGNDSTRPAAAAKDTTRPAPEPARARSHTIRSGDTLDGIAKKYGTTVRALQQANPGLNARRLIPGRTVKLPG